jgi:hypothetical protein
MPISTVPDRTDVRSLAIVIGTAAVIGISYGMFPPLISLKAEAAGISSSWNGILAGIPAVAILVLGPGFRQSSGSWACSRASTQA